MEFLPPAQDGPERLCGTPNPAGALHSQVGILSLETFSLALAPVSALLAAATNAQIILEPGGASLGKGSLFIPGIISTWIHTGNPCSCFSCGGRKEELFNLSQTSSPSQ